MKMGKKHIDSGDGTVPVNVLNQLNEHTAGGFVLFYFNSKNGSPEEAMIFDSPAYCLGLQKHIADWSCALQELGIDSERQYIEQSCKLKEKKPDDEDTI